MQLANFRELSLLNWIQITTATTFLILSRKAYKSNWSRKKKDTLSFAFMLTILLTTFSVSYIVSLYNTKNTLTVFLIGIVTVSLFFVIEYRKIATAAAIISSVFVLSIIFIPISVNQKIMNVYAGLFLGFVLLCFSRYNYYFKSQHFVKIKQLEEKNKEIEILNNRKKEILTFVAHDLRNPLSNIEILSEMISEKYDPNLVVLITKSAIQAQKIIQDLIEAEKEHEESISRQQVNVFTYIKSIIDKWRIDNSRKILLINNTEDIDIEVNISKIERVIDNLISNGLKFSPKDSNLEILLNQDDFFVDITIKDYGIGIPKDLQQHLFDQFSAAGRTGLQGEKSIGLGLHISKKIVEQHGGTISVLSSENKGTAFTIKLPIAS
ncbi:integral membrane sensor signal transduction histidine kinase [Pseudopedobacter saltans DSM 12145]|uniref:histidine kinase n=1 Tax=Pseudopedobacter saltans (strain ATCC 51119 / DSM 12145 / JCM 21818 / CCUG 39354 / LMG 10337 / NBRC 100064 / NCIMB 13643) TaxID=762903 RepID=F0S4G7_PSESL|nr:HAMP domain-containing sensor histidine kinase [Pseudopedobacter saltans]ADY51958.1 integral membrane sensor signal transduction histidine kinase [Pseudopedobacter saltans DSM 12145]